MVYHTCPDCDEENYFTCYDSKRETITKETDEKYQALTNRIKQKIIDLQGQIITAYTDKTSAIADTPNDVLRYTAMIDVLKAMLQ